MKLKASGQKIAARKILFDTSFLNDIDSANKS